ncbi:hypothetical protein ANSO36C_36840 [Nostoc cf. commune SO-36]|uniref:Uncharacterized protein n=1 Tax=Nostoc cf. commune SO-36 TaxID=449208 RepID=A0ABM7Z4D5_NOSCO|nr:hypothetical protein ANSO36C_36840 [Nostoc cf. commune SO-36]
MVLEAENQGVLVESFKGALTLKTTAAAPQFGKNFKTDLDDYQTKYSAQFRLELLIMFSLGSFLVLAALA